ncbi:MAG TPA: RraA family protein [Ilumatobacter sp.]|nr:RraA family protein [Ilumatobacter sp.]
MSLDALRAFDTPTVSNAIDSLGLRPAAEGYTYPPVHAVTAPSAPVVGYAVTAAIRTVAPFADADEQRAAMLPLYPAVASVNGPKIVVVQDLDHADGLDSVGCLWGEVNVTLCQAMGAVGVVTDGLVRDVPDVEALGFHYVARGIGVARGNTRVVSTLEPVAVGGLTVTTGDVIHADRHGAVLVPADLVDDVLAAAERINASEARLLEWARSPEFHADEIAARRNRR